MKIINRLLILVVIVGGVWFLAKNWNTETPDTTTPANEAEISEEVVAVDGEEKNDRDPITPPINETPKVTFDNTPVQQKPATTVKPTVVTTTTTPADEPAAIPQDATRIRVYLYEWAVDISDKTIPAGPVVFEVRNTGKFTHHFAVEGVKDFGKVIPGATEEFTLTLSADDYTLISPREVDTFHDMRETLLVD